jgi:arabinogalactan oligomer/maltooligosaccharide transport system substrate-binding protein
VIPLLLFLAAQPEHVVLWHSYRAKEKEALEELAARWNAQPDVPRLELLSVPYDALADKISAAVPRGHGPDLFIFAHDRIGDWAESKIVEPIEFYVDEALCDRFLRKTIDALTYGDSLYGLPMAFKSAALVYNQKLVPKPPATTAELLALGRRLTDRRAGRYGLVYENTRLYFHSPWLHGYGGEVFGADGQLHVATPEAVRALEFARLLGGPDGIVPPEASGILLSTLFDDGKAAMVLAGPWFIGEIRPGLPFGVAPLPIVSETGRPAEPFLSVEAVLLSSQSKNKPAAFRVMEYLTSDGAALVRAEHARQTVANVATYSEPTVARDPVVAAFRAQLDHTHAMPGTPEMRIAWAPYDMAIAQVVALGGDSKAALAEAEQKIRDYLRGAHR